MTAAAVLDWLLEGDPAIRWQTMRDLMGAPTPQVERERARISRAGWGKRLLALQDRDGNWGGGLYTPKWTSTTYTMLLLRDFGLAAGPATRRACARLLDLGINPDGGIAYGFWKQSETCVTGMVLSILCHFDHQDDRVDHVVEHLLARQMEDGGWNCRLPRGATHASVHTTISVLEALHLYEHRRGRKLSAVRAAQRGGREFLLAHRLFRSHRTGEVINPVFLKLSFPPRWHYDVLRGLDHFRASGAPRDARLTDAIEVVRAARLPDGRWPLEHVYGGKTFFSLETPGRPSRWNTLRAMRVLEWWEGVGGARSKGPSRRRAAAPTRSRKSAAGAERARVRLKPA